MSQIGPRIKNSRAVAVLSLGILAVAAPVVAWLWWRAEPGAARDARDALAGGRYDQAGKALERWIGTAPDAAEAHYLKGRAAVATGRLHEAAGELKRAQELGYPRDELDLLRALIASKAGRHTEAEAILKQAFAESRMPDRQVDEALAKTFLETYNLTGATTVLERWARDFPDDPKPYLWRAEVHIRTGSDATAAENDYREALRRDPSLARARRGLAEELRKAHRNAEAAEEYEFYLDLEPTDAVAHLGAGQNRVELGDENAATGHLKRAVELDANNAAAYKELAELVARRADWSASLALLDRAIALDPADVTLRYRRGLALSRLGRADQARAEQAAATRLRHDLDRLTQARKRLIAAPHDRKSQLEVARWMFDHAQDHEGARWAQKILAEHPDDPEANRLLADYHQRRGETGLANFYRLRESSGPEPASTGKEGERR